MPHLAPLTKINNCKGFGANVQLYGNHLQEARERADELSMSEGLTYINGAAL